MIRLVRPWRYPHREGRVYTSLGFRRRVVRALLRDGFTPREVQRLTDLYMGSRDLQEHQDDTGMFRNVRRYRLHHLSRRWMKYDRKSPLFDIVRRSGLFYVFVEDDEENGVAVKGFLSPREVRMRGTIAP